MINSQYFKKLNNLEFSYYLFLFVITLYFPIIGFGFIWDDFELYENFISKSFFELISNKLDTIYSIHYYPLFHLSHQIDYFFTKLIFVSQINNTHFTYAIIPHITNLIVYLFACYFFYQLTKFFFNEKLIQYLTSLIFAVHPIHVNSVSWISGRTDLLATFFCILSILYFCKLYQKQDYQNLFFASFFYVCAVFSKIVSLTLIGSLVLFFIFFIVKEKSNIKNQIYNIYFFLIAIIAIIIFFNLYFRFTHITNTDEIFSFEIKGLYFVIKDISGIFSYYFSKLFFPFNHDVIASNLPEGIYFIVGLSIFILALFYSVLKLVNDKDFFPLACFLSIIFSLTTAIYSYSRGGGENEQLIISTVAERFAFLPSVFACLFIGHVLKNTKLNFKNVYAIILILVFSVLVILRLPSHQDQKYYAEYTEPDKRLVYHYMVLLQSFDAIEDYEKLKVVLEDAIKKYPNKSKFYIKYAILEKKNGNIKKFEQLQSQARAMHANDDHFNYYAALIFFNEKKFDISREYLMISIESSKNLQDQIRAMLLLSEIEKLENNIINSKKILSAIMRVDPKNAEAYFKMGKLFLLEKDKDKAIKFIQKAVELDPKIVSKFNIK